MTTVPARPPVPPGRGKRYNVRDYNWWRWARAYASLIVLSPIYAIMWALATFVKTLPDSITRKLLRAHIRYTTNHPMDFRIPPDESVDAYMKRWWRVPRNWFLNIYYHIILRSDDDRALHDHPWFSFSIVLKGGYFEHTIDAGGVHRKTWKGPGAMTFRWSGRFAHRLELKRQAGFDPDGAGAASLVEQMATTIFITGPVMRRWGFHDGPRGWIDAYEWDAHCERHGIKSMKMDGGSDAAISPRNLI